MSDFCRSSRSMRSRNLDNGNLELGHLPVAQIVEVEHLAHFLKREANRLAGQHVGQPRAVASGIEPLLAAPGGVEQSLLLVEAQRARRDGEFPGEVAGY